jgi:enediyne biosynthesis protein E5
MTEARSAITTVQFYPKSSALNRYFALWYFTGLLIIWNIAGYSYLGFEQAYIMPLVGVASALVAQFGLEWLDARLHGCRPRYAGGWKNVVNLSPPAIISGLACSMLTYTNTRISPLVFATVLSIGSKVLFRAPVGNGKTQHIFNPSNIGITATLLLLPAVGLAPPYQFTENIVGIWNWIIPGVILLTGIYIHGRFTGRLTLVLAWLVGFAAQGLIRSAMFHSPVLVPFVPMTSAAFTLFTLYMIPDPATTPLNKVRQAIFGFSTAAVYGLLLVWHIVDGMFIALMAVCAVRGLGLYAIHFWKLSRAAARVETAQPIPQMTAADAARATS